jgi:hypothetical protein
VICIATARNVASDIAFGFYRCGVPAGQSRVICAAIPRSSGSCQYQGRSSRFVRMARNTSPLTQTHVSRFYLKRIDDSRTSDSRGRSVGRSVEHAANDCRREKICQDRLIGEAPPMGVSGAFLDPTYTTYSPQFRAGSVESLNPRGAVRSTIDLQKILPGANSIIRSWGHPLIQKNCAGVSLESARWGCVTRSSI